MPIKEYFRRNKYDYHAKKIRKTKDKNASKILMALGYEQ